MWHLMELKAVNAIIRTDVTSRVSTMVEGCLREDRVGKERMMGGLAMSKLRFAVLTFVEVRG